MWHFSLDFGRTASQIHNCLVSTTTSTSTAWSKFCYVALGSCYLQEEKLQIIKIFTTCVKKLEMFSNFLWEKCPYPKAESWKWKQFFLSTSFPAKKVIYWAQLTQCWDVYSYQKMVFFHNKILINTVNTFHTKNCFDW